jgi:hypothetical protein
MAAGSRKKNDSYSQLRELIRLRDRLRKAELARRSPRIERRQKHAPFEACTSLAAKERPGG